MATTVEVRVHRRGSNPGRDAKIEKVVRDDETNRLYTHDGIRWWMLSNGINGWHSINVGMPEGFDPR